MVNQHVSESARRAAEKRSAYLSLPPLDVRQRYTLGEASMYLRQSIAQTYKQIAAGQLRVIKSGARTYVHGSEIERFSAEAIAA